MVIGVAGKSCSGKDIICKILVKYYHAHVINVDTIGWSVLKEKQTEILSAFGNVILDNNGQIDRSKLGNFVFSNPKYIKTLNNITHPLIIEKIKKLLKNYSKNDTIILNAALLSYLNISELKVTIWVKSNSWIRILRSLLRDKRGIFFTLKRIWIQKKLSPKLFFKKVDTYVVYNNGSLRTLELKVFSLAKILKLRELG